MPWNVLARFETVVLVYFDHITFNEQWKRTDVQNARIHSKRTHFLYYTCCFSHHQLRGRGFPFLTEWMSLLIIIIICARSLFLKSFANLKKWEWWWVSEFKESYRERYREQFIYLSRKNKRAWTKGRNSLLRLNQGRLKIVKQNVCKKLGPGLSL